jgi:hypothetical protein
VRGPISGCSSSQSPARSAGLQVKKMLSSPLLLLLDFPQLFLRRRAPSRSNQGSDDISGYSIGGNVGGPGSLATLQGSPYAAGTAPSSIAVDPTGRFAFVVNSGSGTIAVYAIDQTSGALSEVAGSPYVTGALPSAVAISD